jgi:translation elongation factor EF-1alpha
LIFHFFNTLDLVPIPDRNSEAAIRMPIIDKMKDQGSIYLLGKIESGCIKEDMWVCCLPYRKQF